MNTTNSSVDPHARNWVWRSFQLLMQNVFVFAFRYRIRGAEQLPDGGALLLMNHQSFIDPLVVAVSFQRPVSYLARHNLFSVPLIGTILRNAYVIPIRRNAASTESIRAAIERLKQGYYVGLFPEGTRSQDGLLHEMKPGFLAIVRRASVPIIPIGIAGAGTAYPRGVVFIRPRTVRVVVGQPFSAEEVREYCEAGKEAELMADIRFHLEQAMQSARSWIDPTSERS